MAIDDYSQGSDGYEYEEEEDVYNEADLTEDLSKTETKNHTIMTQADIRRHQEDAISEVCAVLSVPRSAAITLLLHHHWSVHKLHEAWFSDEEAVRKAVGLFPESKTPRKRKRSAKCGICLERHPFRKVSSSTNCCHYYCKRCWKRYIRAAVESGSGCLTLRCPEQSCGSAVGQDVIDSLAGRRDKAKYANILARSYVELGLDTKWCPAPGCEFIIRRSSGGGGTHHDVYCDCGNGFFCWNCNEEPHSPMDCETVKNWIAKNTSESKNTAWIVANSKPCPKCRRPIEKNDGCMHMTCGAPCRHQFCWLCLKDWKDHSGGDFYNCNIYNASKKSGELIEGEQERRLAKLEIKRYRHYYERWAANHKSWKRSLDDLKKVKTETIPKLISVLKDKPAVEDMDFVVDAWKQVVECRRVLKWTYAYGYFLPENETKKKQLFEFVQGEAERELERLHGFAEKEMRKQLDLLDKNVFEEEEEDADTVKEFRKQLNLDDVFEDEEEDKSVDAFKEFRKKLVGLTSVTRNYFEKLVAALEKGLPVVPNEGGSSSQRMPPSDGWPCDRCTYINQIEAVACVMCSITPD